MPRRLKTPTYRLHKPSGRAVLTLNRRDFYLGPFGSQASRNEYDRLIAEWLANGRRLPDQATQDLTINELVLRYYGFCESYYSGRRNVAKMLSRIRAALRPLGELFGRSSAAAGFGPKALMLVRAHHAASGLARKTVNDNTQIIKRMFKWAVREEIIPPSVHHGLGAVEGLRAGESLAREPRKVEPVPDAYVEAVVPLVLPPVRAMIRLQQLTGMRSGEVTIIRTGDLEMTKSLWIYRPRQHKSEYRGFDRNIVLGPQAQRIILPFLRPNLEEYLFRPDEAEAQRDAERGRRRQTPLWPSSLKRRQRNRRRSVNRAPGDHYSVDTFAQAIRRACARARVPAWTPHQLRHSYATRIRKSHGIEAARVMLGHQHVGVTEVYAERDQTVAATIASTNG